MRKALYFLGLFNDEELEWIMDIGHRQEILAGTTLISQGAPIDKIYIILDGAFSVFMQDREEQEVARLLSGELVGEMSFVDSRPPSATVKAVDDAQVLSIPRQKLATKLKYDMSFAAHFYQALSTFLADRLRTTNSQLGYGRTAQLDATTEEEDELSPNALDNMYLAGTRFDLMRRNLLG